MIRVGDFVSPLRDGCKYKGLYGKVFAINKVGCYTYYCVRFSTINYTESNDYKMEELISL
jgi:hypothetical protein